MNENRSTPAKDGGQRPKTQGRIYALTQQDAQASNAVVTGTIPVSGIHASVLFDSGTIHSFISTTFIRQHNIGCGPMKTKLYVETPVGGILSTESVCKSCSIKIGERELSTDLVVLDMHDFDIILGMDWLATYHASVDCHEKRVNFHIPGELTFNFDGSTETTPPRIISFVQAR